MDERCSTSANGRLAISALGGKTLKVWSIVKGRKLHTLTVSGYKHNVALSADGQLAVSEGSILSLGVQHPSRAQAMQIERNDFHHVRDIFHRTWRGLMSLINAMLRSTGRLAVYIRWRDTRVLDISLGSSKLRHSVSMR